MGALDILFGTNKGKTHEKVPKTVQQSIPYTKVFKDGTIETTPGNFTRVYKLEDINFKIAPDTEQVAIFRAYGNFLNSFSPNVHFQIVIQNHAADRREIIEAVRFRPQRDGLNKYRQEMNGILIDKVTEGRKNLRQDKYLVISIKGKNIENVMRMLDSIEKDVEKGIHGISRDVSIDRVSVKDRLEMLFGIYNQDGESVFYNATDKEGEPYFDFNTIYKSGLTTKDIIGPSGMEFKPNCFRLGDTWGRAMFLENVPNWLSPDFISDLSDITCNMLISTYHVPIDTAKAMRMIKDHMTAVNAQIASNQKKAIQGGYSYDLIAPDLAMQQKQTKDLIDDVVGRDQKLYFLTFTICIFAQTKQELDSFTRTIQSVANKHLCPIRTLDYQQEQGFNSSLPLAVRQVETKRLYTTESASVFIPYTTLELYQKEGIYYGLNQTSKNMIMYSRLSARNYNGLIFGESGAGKSFTAKCEMVSVLLRSDKNRIYVIDPEAEYVSLVKALHGEVVDLSPGSQTFVNPLDMDIDYDGESSPIGMKVEYIISMIEIMLGHGRGGIRPEEKSIINRCVNTIYRPYIDHISKLNDAGSDVTCDKDAMPTINNLYNELLRQPEPEAHSIASILEVYATGTLATFAHRSNVETDANICVYNIKNLGTGMKDLGLHVCLNDIWNKMIENKKKGLWTWIYIDEFYLLLQSDSAARFLMQVWKRARKWQGVPTGIMQNTEDLLRSADSRNIINNTSFVMMLSLPKLDRMNLGDLLQIPESQLDYINNSAPGKGLIYTGRTILPFDNQQPENTNLYKLMTTKAGEN